MEARKTGRTMAMEQALILESTDVEINETEARAATLAVQTMHFLRQGDVEEFGAEEIANNNSAKCKHS